MAPLYFMAAERSSSGGSGGFEDSGGPVRVHVGALLLVQEAQRKGGVRAEEEVFEVAICASEWGPKEAGREGGVVVRLLTGRQVWRSAKSNRTA